MIFKEIELSEALRIIGEGAKNKELYFLRCYKGEDLKSFGNYNIAAHQIKDHRWFVRIEEDTK